MPLTALAAWQGLFQTARLQNGERVLIHGVAAGVGSFAAQFAKLHGAYVIGTGDAADESFARELGVDEFINFKETRFEDRVRDVDMVFATIGGEVIHRSFDVMQPGGRLVTTGQIEGLRSAREESLARLNGRANLQKPSGVYSSRGIPEAGWQQTYGGL